MSFEIGEAPEEAEEREAIFDEKTRTVRLQPIEAPLRMYDSENADDRKHKDEKGSEKCIQ